MRRCDKAAKLYLSGKVQHIFITGVLGEKMKHYLIDQLVATDDITVVPEALTTAGEIKIFSKIIPHTDDIVAVSSWYHLPRIFLIWHAFGRNVGIAPAYGDVSVKDILREFIFLPISLLAPRAFAYFVDSKLD